MMGDSDATFLLTCDSCDHFERIIIDIRGMEVNKIEEKINEHIEEMGWDIFRHHCPSCHKKNFSH